MSGNLVLRPFTAADAAIAAGGNGLCNPVSDGGLAKFGNQYFWISVPDAASYVKLDFQFNGRALGFCLSTVSTAASKNLSAIVNGVAYPLPPIPRTGLDPATSIPGGQHYYPVVNNLADGVHQCTFMIVGDARSFADFRSVWHFCGRARKPPRAVKHNSRQLRFGRGRYAANV